MTRFFLLSSIIVLISCTPARAADGDPWFARDKALHATAGTLLGAGGYGAGALVFDGTGARVTSGMALALGAGAAKEWQDRRGQGTASWRDFTWDAVGAAAGVGVAWLIDHARHGRRAGPVSPTLSKPACWYGCTRLPAYVPGR